MAIVRVECSVAVVGGGVFDPGAGAPAGTWSDNSDATYAIGDSAGQLDKTSAITWSAGNMEIYAHVRYSGSPVDVLVAKDPTGNFGVLTRTTMPGGTVAVPTSTSVLMSGDYTGFVTISEQTVNQLYLIVLGADTNRYYEGYVTVHGPHGEPASCQNFPAISSTSVGGMVQQFPPPQFSPYGAAPGRHT